MSGSERIVALRGTSLAGATNSPEPSVISMLEKALEEALCGEIIAVGIVAARPNNHVSHRWDCPNASGHMLVAGCSYLQFELLANTDMVQKAKDNN